jgi:hypothetical protein
MRDAFLGEMSVALVQSLRDHLESRPQHTYEEKATLARELGEQLARLGLALLCHRTWRPATLIAEPDETGKGYFALEVKDDAGRTLRTLSKRRTLPPLIELVANDETGAPPFRARVGKGRENKNQR